MTARRGLCTVAWRIAVGSSLISVVAVGGAVQTPERDVQPPASQRNFLTCPVVRDTSTVPCWLAEYDGELYYLGSQGSTSSAFYPPQLLHEVLVEATLADGPRVCGGVPLRDVEVSVLPEINRACNTILPAEPAYRAPLSPPAPMPSFAETTREFHVPYDFDSDYLTLHTTRVIQEAVRIAGLMDANRIEVHGSRGAVLLSNGGMLEETEGLGQIRAGKVRGILEGLGIDPVRIRVTWDVDAARPDGVTDRDQRRLIIRLAGN